MIIIYILAAVSISAGVIIYLQKKGKIKDTDGDFIPDVVEDKIEQVEEVVKETKRRAKRVVEEAKDVVDAAKEVVNQSKDVVDAAKGKARKGRKSAAKKTTKSSLRAMKKAELISTAKKEFNVDFDSSLTKTNLINKVYELYNKK